MDKIIEATVQLSCSQEQAFAMFTVNSNLEKWLTRKAEVEPHVGGKYELFWNPAKQDEDSTKGCKVLAVQSPHYLNFEWKGARQQERLMNTKRPFTNVTVIFAPTGSSSTQVNVLHTGWGDSTEWDQARGWFEKAWEDTLAQLQKVINEQ